MEQLGHSPSDLPQPGAVPDTEKELFAAMDAVAVALLQRLKGSVIQLGATETPVTDADMNQILKVMDRAQDWLVKRQKLKPGEQAEDGRGAKMMQEMMNEKPHDVVARLGANPAFHQALINRGWLAPMTKKNGRPTKEEAAERARYKAEVAKRGDPKIDDDSGLRGLLGE